MDSFQTFMGIFERCRGERNSSELFSILKDGPKYFQNLSTNDAALVLSTFLDKSKGLLYLLNDEIKKPQIHPSYDKVITEGYRLLEFIIEQFHTILEPYILNIKETCRLAITRQCNHYIRTAASTALKKLIWRYHSLDLELDELTKEIVQSFNICGIKERSVLYSVVAVIGRYCPEYVRSYSDKIFKYLKNDLELQFKPDNASQPTELQTYLESFTDMLHSFPPSLESTERSKDYCKKLYTYIKKLSTMYEHQYKKNITRAAINLLSEHISLFNEFVYNDNAYWHEFFWKLSTQGSTVNREMGINSLKAYYKAIGDVLCDREDEESRAQFMTLKGLLKQRLMCENLQPNALRLTVYGFSQLAAACIKYSIVDEIGEMYSLIAYRTVPLYSCEAEGYARVDDIIDYQEALSEILRHIPRVSDDQLKALTKLCILLIKRFPDLPVTSQTTAIISLLRTLRNVGSTTRTLYRQFIHDLIYEGIKWSCSHTLYVDAELKRDLYNLKERPICYKNYVSLWQRLLDINVYRLQGRVQMTNRMIDELILTCIDLIGKLNLNTKTKEDNPFSDPSLSQAAVNETDFRIFVNLVDLYSEIFEKVDVSSLSDQLLFELLYEVIKHSYRHPLISGFYKLVHSIIKTFDVFHDAERLPTNSDAFLLLSQYLSKTLDLIPMFSDELQMASLHLILDIPMRMVENVLDRSASVFQIAFAMGLSDFVLASSALVTLERWALYLDRENAKDFFCKVAPSLEPFLQSKETSTELLQDILKSERKKVKRVTFVDSEKSLDEFQRRTLLFLSSLDSDVILNFVHMGSLETGASWDKKDLLKYTLPYPDIRLDISFDRMLPRLTELALNAGDRRTKVIACEVLHAVISVMLGKTVQLLSSDPDHFVPLNRMLYPVMLKLSCDSDPIVRQLFHPLMLQLTHWLSSRLMLRSSNAEFLVETLFESLTDESNSALRDFSGVCLAEFVTWSIKQSTNTDLDKSPVNIEMVVRKIRNFALHPSVWKRIASAIAFNHLYRILREDQKVVNIFWLEILYCFVKSLNGCNDQRINSALDHIEKVIRVAAQIFNKSNPRRKKPAEFEGILLEDAAIWLLTQCGSLDRHCREKSMELLENISPCIKNHDSLERIISHYVSSNGIQGMNNIIVGNTDKVVKMISIENMKSLLRTLDCYIWLFKKKLMKFDILFGDETSCSKDAIFNYISNFVRLLAMEKTENNYALVTSSESEKLRNLQCEVITSLLSFLQVLLEVTDDPMVDVPIFFWSKELFDLMCMCILKPQTIGFDVKNLEIMEALPKLLENLLTVLSLKLNDSRAALLRQILASGVQELYEDFFNINDNINTESNAKLRDYANGLIILQRCRFLSQLCGHEWSVENSDHKITEVFQALRKEQFGRLICTNLDPYSMEYLGQILELLLLNYEPRLINTLVNCIANDTTLVDQDSTNVTHGEYFLNSFKRPICRNMLSNVEVTLKVLFDDFVQTQTDVTLTILEELATFALKYPKSEKYSSELLADQVIERCNLLRRVTDGVEYRRKKFINIYAVVVRLKSDPVDVAKKRSDLYSWILGELSSNSDLEFKTQILRNFLICLTDASTERNPELAVILNNLRNARLSLSIVQSNMDRLKVLECLHTLLKMLPVTKSSLVFDSAIKFAVGAGKSLCNEKVIDYLRFYFDSLSDENVIQSLEIAFRAFIDSGSQEEKSDVLQWFLLPVFRFCSESNVERFFERNIKEIYAIATQSLTGSDYDIKRLMALKIGCYNLIEIMFARIGIEKIDSVDSVLVRNAVGDIKTGKELVVPLYSSALRVRGLKTDDRANKETMRQLHCAAYNCCIAIVSVKKEEKFYVSIFGENRDKEQLIWENIVACDRNYNLGQTFTEFPKRKKQLINIRRTIKETNRDNHSYVHSYDLTSSTLNEDIRAYDLNEATLLSQSKARNEEYDTMSLTFESDDFNDHECMAPICGVLTHMVLNNILQLPEENVPELPQWLKNFRNSMSTRHVNVKLFMLKIITNVQNVFKPYARFFLAPIINAINSVITSKGLNYIVTDVLVMLIDWHSAAIPNNEADKTFAQKLFQSIVNKVAGIDTISIFKYYTDILKTLVEAWHECLTIPENFNAIMEKRPSFATQLIVIFLANNMQHFVISRTDILAHLVLSIKNWKQPEELLLRTCEALSLILKFTEGKEDFSEEKKKIVDSILSSFRQMQSKTQKRLVKCIYVMCKRNPNVADEYFEFVAWNALQVDDLTRSMCLEICLSHMPKLTVQQISTALTYMKFQNIFKNKTLLCEKVGLQIVEKLASTLGSSEILPLSELVTPYSKHNSTEYREIAYSTFMNIYNRFYDDISDDNDARKLIYISRRILLAGLLDPAEELQKKLLRFWMEDRQLTENSSERLLEVLGLYSANVEDDYLPILPLAMLHLTSKSPDFERKMFEPLHNCKFEDYHISTSWRSKNLGSMTPLFVSSLASQLNQRVTQSSQSLQDASYGLSSVRLNEGAGAGPQIRATQTPKFEQTLQIEQSLSRISTQNVRSEGTFKSPRLPQPADNRKSRRMLTDSSKISDAMRHMEIKKNIHRDEMLKEEVVRQRTSVKTYRTYRIGDFPDIEITHSSVITPLQELIKKDQNICKTLTVSIFSSLLNDLSLGEKSREFRENASKGLIDILRNCRGNNSLLGTVLEIMLYSHITDSHLENVVRVSKFSGLLSLGALFLEENIIQEIEGDSGPPAKKSRLNENVDCRDNQWIMLTSLYKSMNEVDVVLGIYARQITNGLLQEASLAQAANDWVKAKNGYSSIYKSEIGPLKDHCLEELYECLSHLSSWDAISGDIMSKLDGDLDTIWRESWTKDWMIPWIFRSQLHKLLDDEPSNEFAEVLNTWISNKDTLNRIKGAFGEEIAMFFLENNDQETARDFLIANLEEVRHQWIHLNPLSTNLRASKLQKLRVINDINIYLKTLKSANISSGVRDLLKRWSSNVPSTQDDVLIWDTCIAYRSHFSSLLEKMNVSEDDDILKELHNARLEQRLNLVEVAINQRNKTIAKKNFNRFRYERLKYEEETGLDVIDEHPVSELLMIAKLKYLYGDVERNGAKKMDHYMVSWTEVHTALNKSTSDADNKIKIAAREHIGILSNTLTKLIDEDEHRTTFIERGTHVAKIFAEYKTRDDLVKLLHIYSLSNLKECCDIANDKEIGDCYLKILKYCYNRISSVGVDVELFREFVRSTLRAMSYGSREATRYFPCLLTTENLGDDETREIFKRESEGVQTWMFLPWQAQLLSYLGTSIADAISPIVERIAKTYPNAMIYSIRLTIETNEAVAKSSLVCKIKEILFNKPELEQFIAAMQYLVQPELYLQYYLTEWVNNLSQGKTMQPDFVEKMVYPATIRSKETPVQGDIYKRIATYKAKVKTMENKKNKAIELSSKEILQDLKRALETRQNKTQLKDYSPWLYRFSGETSELEVPGQYTGEKKPLPHYHARIMKFEPDIKVMQSKRKPIRITMVGNDAKAYKFLIKFGEDLRLDQRLQQLFTIMNEILQADVTCRQRHLLIDTYQVIPLSSALGLIQWVDSTRPLQDFIYFTLTEPRKRQYDSLRATYANWIKDAAPRKTLPEQYKEALSKYSAQDVTAKMNELGAQTEWNSLRKTFQVLSCSPESFVALRRNFILSYGTMCVAHWILGIGDRHLGNTLIAVTSGRSLGIDFGLAFGAGIDQAVPELMPFRLTNQILGLLRPFDANGLLGITMTHVLRAMRNGRGSLVACMQVFVHEPINWSEQVNKRLKENHEEYNDVKWFPKRKINMVEQKLNGIKPSLITLDQLKDHHEDAYFPRYTQIVSGYDDNIKRPRVNVEDELLGPEEQVRCLLDQATDPNILGRVYVGWSPWL